MGKYGDDNEKSMWDKKLEANRALAKVTSMNFLCQLVNQKLSQLPHLESPDLCLEQDLRLLLNILLNYTLLNCNDDPQVRAALTHKDNQIEDLCFRAVKYSLEVAVVPIRKVLILFTLYLRMLFGDMPAETRQEWRGLKYGKELAALVEKEEPRFQLKDVGEVEKFYKRHMSSDNPIPQILVVGILRVLLTTCPNAARNTGGIDLHAEWSSCLQFYCQKREFFEEHQYKSAHFRDIDQLQDFAGMDEFKFENDRHRVIVALLIAEFFLFLMKHFKHNHVIQFIYISQLVVDANGVLVLLKFLN